MGRSADAPQPAAAGHPLLLFLGGCLPPLLVYWATMPTDLTHAFFSVDGGELMAAAATLGVPHPPGYPTYTLLGHLLIRLPLSLAIPIRFHLLSAVSTSLACGLVALVADLRWPHSGRRAAWAAALLCAFSSLVWQQAVVAEVYAFHVVWLMLTIWLATTGRSPLWVGLCWGIALTSHLTAALLLPLLLTRLPSPFGRHLWYFLVGATAGSLPWLLLPWLGSGPKPIVWGDPSTFAGWWWLVSATLYRPNVLGASTATMIQRLVEWGPYLLLLLGGTWLLFPLRRWIPVLQPGLPGQPEQHPAASPSFFPFLATAALFILYAWGYRAADALVLALPAVFLLAIELPPLIKPLGLYVFLLPIALLGLNFSPILTARTATIRQETHALLATIPHNALVITDGRDESIFTLWYVQHVEGIRPDLSIVDQNLIAFDWYRARISQHSPSRFPIQLEYDQLDRLIADQRQLRPVCFVSVEPYSTNCINHE